MITTGSRGTQYSGNLFLSCNFSAQMISWLAGHYSKEIRLIALVRRI